MRSGFARVRAKSIFDAVDCMPAAALPAFAFAMHIRRTSASQHRSGEWNTHVDGGWTAADVVSKRAFQ